VAASAALLLVTVTLRAQQAPPANLVPVTAASLAAQPERYVGKIVAVHGSVETFISATAFSVDQDPTRATLTDVLVIAPNLMPGPSLPGFSTIFGVPMLALAGRKNSNLVSRPLIEPKLTRTLTVIRRRGVTLPPASQEFLAMLKKRWAQQRREVRARG
jgi:hypothetical protein